MSLRRVRWSRVSAIGLSGVIAFVACGGELDPASALPPNGGDERPEATVDGSALDPDAGNPDASIVDDPDGSARHLRIQFDYRFDKAGFFSVPERKQSLEAAAQVWSELLHDSFERIPKGTYAISRDPEHYAEKANPVTLDADIEGLLIFVGTAEWADHTIFAQAAQTAGFSGVTDRALADRLHARFEGADHEPWTAWMSFRRSEDWYFDPAPTAGGAVPADKADFASAAIHTIAHVLGFSESKAWMAFASGGFFRGPNAVATWGGDVPLASDGFHLPLDMKFDGTEVLMDEALGKGKRTFPSRLDLAMMKDIGYEL